MEKFSQPADENGHGHMFFYLPPGLLQVTLIVVAAVLPDWKTPPYYFHKSLRWNFEDL